MHRQEKINSPANLFLSRDIGFFAEVDLQKIPRRGCGSSRKIPASVAHDCLEAIAAERYWTA